MPTGTAVVGEDELKDAARALMVSSNTSLERASLDSSKHAFVNAFLKSLKLHTRKLSALLSQHATELTVLERIYYINNNQHRAAHFWKRVVEARRYSRRLRSSDISSFVNSLRGSFYNDPPDASLKPHKGAWSHYPPAPSLKSFLARLRTCTALLDKARRSLHSPLAQTDTLSSADLRPVLTLAMRSGAFLHLVVTLTALVARLTHLSSALRHVLSALHAESIRLLHTLHARQLRVRPRGHLGQNRDLRPHCTLSDAQCGCGICTLAALGSQQALAPGRRGEEARYWFRRCRDEKKRSKAKKAQRDEIDDIFS
ncbi:hypothetical protein H4582DRAFT_2052303 [Lactarius indigo]|nr:hypothetical protein H4582DRAFT_2052303 [Lactarius indigo]